MTKLSPLGTRSPLMLPPDLSEEDRSTHRRWARAWYACGLIFMAGLLAIGLSMQTHHSPAGLQGQIVSSIHILGLERK
jgi:hypothetical protein